MNTILISEPDRQSALDQNKGSQQKAKKANTDISGWLAVNSPDNWDELVNLRYCLYHRCSRAQYKVKRIDGARFIITGPNGSLLIASEDARHFLLFKLRNLAREREWVGGLSRLRNELRGIPLG